MLILGSSIGCDYMSFEVTLSSPDHSPSCFPFLSLTCQILLPLPNFPRLEDGPLRLAWVPRKSPQQLLSVVVCELDIGPGSSIQQAFIKEL